MGVAWAGQRPARGMAVATCGNATPIARLATGDPSRACGAASVACYPGDAFIAFMVMRLWFRDAQLVSVMGQHSLRDCNGVGE
jgi:hypothetical protein